MDDFPQKYQPILPGNTWYDLAVGRFTRHGGGAGGASHGMHVVSLLRWQGRQSEGPDHER